MSYEIGIFILGLLLGGCLTALYFDRRDAEKRLKELEERLKKPSPVPFTTREEIENAMAGLLLIKNKIDYENDVYENIVAHLIKARNGNGKIKP